CISLALALFVVQLKNRAEHIPISGKLYFQRSIMFAFFRFQLVSVRLERGIHLRPNLFESGPVRFGPIEVRLQQVITNVRTGEINVGSNIVQNLIRKKDFLSYLTPVGSDLL